MVCSTPACAAGRGAPRCWWWSSQKMSEAKQRTQLGPGRIDVSSSDASAPLAPRPGMYDTTRRTPLDTNSPSCLGRCRGLPTPAWHFIVHMVRHRYPMRLSNVRKPFSFLVVVSSLSHRCLIVVSSLSVALARCSRAALALWSCAALAARYYLVTISLLSCCSLAPRCCHLALVLVSHCSLVAVSSLSFLSFIIEAY